MAAFGRVDPLVVMAKIKPDRYFAAVVIEVEPDSLVVTGATADKLLALLHRNILLILWQTRKHANIFRDAFIRVRIATTENVFSSARVTNFDF